MVCSRFIQSSICLTALPALPATEKTRGRQSRTLKQRLQALAPGLTPKAVLEKLATIRMLDVCLPTTDGRWLVMPRYTNREPEQQLLLHRLKLSLPSQPLPRLKAESTQFPAEALRL